MRDKFADLEEPKFETAKLFFGLLVLLAIFLAYSWSGATAVTVSGVVQSAGSATFGKIMGGTRQIASVRLADGTIVQAYVVSDNLVSPGDNVELLQEHRLLGGSTFQIVAKK